jgi:signal transduction histidine kinase
MDRPLRPRNGPKDDPLGHFLAMERELAERAIDPQGGAGSYGDGMGAPIARRERVPGKDTNRKARGGGRPWGSAKGRRGRRPKELYRVSSTARKSDLETASLDELRHEVRNALTSVSGYAQLVLRRLPSDGDARLVHALLAIRDGVDRAWRLVEPGPEGTVHMQCDLSVLVRRATSQLPPERFEDLAVCLLTETPLIGCWDGDSVTQILANLLDNAAKYSPPGSPIAVELARVTDRGQAWALVAVRDQGIGISARDLARIFSGYRSPGARAPARGRGLGLQLSQRLAAAEGGRLHALGA